MEGEFRFDFEFNREGGGFSREVGFSYITGWGFVVIGAIRVEYR